MLRRGENLPDAIGDMSVRFIFGVPYLVASISKERVRLKLIDTGDVFDEPALIAVEHRRGRKFVRGVGHNMDALNDAPSVFIHNPFESAEPLFPEFDMAVAYFNHALNEIFNRRLFYFLPKVVLQLRERHSPLSFAEMQILRRFTKKCGLMKLYVFIDGDAFVSEDNKTSHAELCKMDHYVAQPKLI